MSATEERDAVRWSSAWRLRDSIVRGALSSEAVVGGALEQIGALDPVLRAFITVVGDRARDEARRADAAVARGEPVGALHGVPVAVKDEAWTQGIPSSGGSLLYRDFVPAEDGVVSRRLREAGAVIVGKTNMPEFAAWPRSLSRMVGESVNPWDVRRTSGASSGGSAAALAAGLVPLAVGSDGGGSIRIPSALCGVVGLHPTAGRVPSWGSFSYSPYASLGPMARDVRDVATLFLVLAGHDPDDPTSSNRAVPDVLASLDDGVAGLRVGFTPDFGYIPVQAGIVNLVVGAAKRLETAGARVEAIDVRLDDVWETFVPASAGYGRYGDGPAPYTQTAEFEDFRRRPRNLAQLCEYTRTAMEAPPTTRAEYEDALERRGRLLGQFEALFADHDVIVTPTMHVTAPFVPAGWDTPYSDPWMGTPFTAIVNLLGLTAASYPAGLLDGLPVAIHVIAPAWDEATVLRVCRALEVLQPWTERPPVSAGR